MTLEQFNKKYKYKTDKKLYGFFEVWTEPKEINGKIEGDCEDYCIYLKKNVKYFKDWDYYYCELNGNGHCILSDGELMIDCNLQKVYGLAWYRNKEYVSNLYKYNWFVVASKFIVGKIFKILRK